MPKRITGSAEAAKMRFGVEGTGAAKQRRQELREREEKRILAAIRSIGGVWTVNLRVNNGDHLGSLLTCEKGAFLNLYQGNEFYCQEVF